MSLPEAEPGPRSMSAASSLGLGLLLAWLLLLYLLVDVWLLCVITSLLLVLGGGLGLQAVLGSHSHLRLERFVHLEEMPASSEAEQQLDLEIRSTVRKIVRDFVRSWYSKVSPEKEFEEEVQRAMHAMALELKRRAGRVDRGELTLRVLELWGRHLQTYLHALELLERPVTEPEGLEEAEAEHLWRAYNRVSSVHPALRSGASELNQARATVDLLLQVLAPPPHLETRTGRLVVRELLTCNVLLPLISTLADPHWINLLLVNLLTWPDTPAMPPPSPPATALEPEEKVETETKEDGKKKKKEEEEEEEEPLPEVEALPWPRGDTEAGNEASELSSYEVVDSEELLYCPPVLEEAEPAPYRLLRPGKTSNPFYLENESDLDSPLSDRRSLESLLLIGSEDPLAERLRDCATPTELLDTGDLDNDLQYFPGLSPNTSCPPRLSENTSYPPGLSLNSSCPPGLSLNTSCSPGLSLNTSCSPGLSEHPSYPRVVVDQGEDSRPVLRARDSSSSSLTEMDRAWDRDRDSLRERGRADTPDRELLLGVPEGVAGGLSPSPQGSFSFEPLSPEGPVVISNLRITGTITAQEHRGSGSNTHPYTLYTVKYETSVGCAAPGPEWEPPLAEAAAPRPEPEQVAYHTVNRRYSEFLTLQSRLEEKPQLRKLIKNVKRPKKMLPELPFGNMDSVRVEARKAVLEAFLKDLCAIPETANSEEMQEFLALNTDARIAFVKKPFITVRINKFVVNAIVDTLKTAFPRSEPQSPTEEPEGETETPRVPSERKNRVRLKVYTKMSPALNGSDLRPDVVYAFADTRRVCERPSLSELEEFLREQEQQAGQAARQDPGPEAPSGPPPQEKAGTCVCQQAGPGAAAPSGTGPTALAEVFLDVVCVLLRGWAGWFCQGNVQRTVRLLFGTLINRWLEVGVSNLTCTQYWVAYLAALQEALWPGGVLLKKPRPLASPEQRRQSKQEALHGLMGLLPDRLADLLGADPYRLSWQTALDSLQDPKINRHLVHCIRDILLEFLVPESADTDFQKSLQHNLSKHHEKP